MPLELMLLAGYAQLCQLQSFCVHKALVCCFFATGSVCMCVLVMDSIPSFFRCWLSQVRLVETYGPSYPLVQATIPAVFAMTELWQMHVLLECSALEDLRMYIPL